MPEIAPLRRSQNGGPSVFQLLLQRFDTLGQANLAEAEAVQGEPDQHDADEAEHERDAHIGRHAALAHDHWVDAGGNQARYHKADRHVDEGDDAEHRPVRRATRRWRCAG